MKNIFFKLFIIFTAVFMNITIIALMMKMFGFETDIKSLSIALTLIGTLAISMLIGFMKHCTKYKTK